MSTRGNNLKTILLVVLVIASFILSAGPVFSAEKKVVLNKYPQLKIGFTTTNFLKFLPVSLDNAKKMVDLAAEIGFPWIELRDPSATLTYEECKQLAAYAESKNIEIGYALQVGLLDPTFWEIFSRGVANAMVFKGPRTIRTLAAGGEFGANPKKTAWNLDEFSKVVKRANKAGNLASSHCLRYVAENSFEVIKGDGLASFGLTEFFANVNSNVYWQFDTANFFAVCRVYTPPEAARAFLEKQAKKMPYIHAKTSSPEHKALPYLADNELDFGIIFEEMVKNKSFYVAIELVPGNTYEETVANHKKSVEYLLGKY
ncbi:MAG: sugar phosphate isomerase/epimerase family protein [Thermodesulfobacteriota bacterium]